MSDISKLVPRGRLQRVIKRGNDLSERIDEIAKRHMDQVEADLESEEKSVRRDARNFLVNMKKLAIEGQKLQADIIRLDLDNRQADIMARGSGVASIEMRQKIQLTEEAVTKILRSTDDAEAPAIIESKPDVLDAVIGKKA